MERWNDPMTILQETLIYPYAKQNSFYEESRYTLGSFEPPEFLERMELN